MISVCMAVYNGERYLLRQLESILGQLAAGDEIVIVDDASTDSSKDIIVSLNDARIRFLTNERNQGVLKSFERALRETQGDYIFFSDQDDVWASDKVTHVLECFKETDSLAVVTDAKVINGAGGINQESYFKWRNSGPGFLKNSFKNTFLGCCMAIRKECKRFLLPFPPFAYMHDRWIGLACTIVGSVKFLPQQLLIYNRHDATVTRMQPSNGLEIIRLRVLLALSMLISLPRLLRWRRKFSLCGKNH